ncbi:hypothetical protein LSTR_LSTR006569 [Laodelphax striatellus]|uniref:Secreted protein n=1 Tax=Laodelphax striatellus TaxID=195883 RepID=A0A482WUR9_LAOST|nr:hypothetical protein LSTR_LSTR006569 [Laodelphax striatellus]
MKLIKLILYCKVAGLVDSLVEQSTSNLCHQVDKTVTENEEEKEEEKKTKRQDHYFLKHRRLRIIIKTGSWPHSGARCFLTDICRRHAGDVTAT